VQPAERLRSLIWSRDGKLAYSIERETGRLSVCAMHPDIDTAEIVVIESGGNVRAPTVSPDGQWVAYVSDEFGSDEVFVTRFPEAGDDTWRVSLDGGTEPAWAHSARELFYRTPDGQLVSRRVNAGDVVELGEVQSLFDASMFRSDPDHREYDVASDDQRFIMSQSGMSTSTLTLVVNWFEEVKERVGR
jgi:Tol biopolymer transport system component